ncbi:hypothetical protein BHT95_07700 [Bacillus paralicheniformis]|nr:hypothetical protein [Bacillus paralicheniformis]MSO01642.1 hypothetical protein [Bacillus paralicheniformis]MSO05635.1 hypothetical protein [Bacillus paralicheniformis]MSO09628.1 hypothetical protein [Bacillus paralicheniformis]NJE37866.1 hypothetical protein [Bacillus paralicheniformis]
MSSFTALIGTKAKRYIDTLDVRKKEVIFGRFDLDLKKELRILRSYDSESEKWVKRKCDIQ